MHQTLTLLMAGHRSHPTPEASPGILPVSRMYPLGVKGPLQATVNPQPSPPHDSWHSPERLSVLSAAPTPAGQQPGGITPASPQPLALPAGRGQALAAVLSRGRWAARSFSLRTYCT